MPPDPRAVDAVARRQYQVITRSQLLALGATPTWIRHRIRSGRWQRLFPGRYAVHDGPAAWRTRATAALACFERRDGLPPARLQVRERLDDGWIRADAIYDGLGVRTELDGALAHPGGRTDEDT